MCKISVIIPFYNEEKYLSAAIDAVLAQSLTDFELILIDDGSDDLGAEICRAYLKKDSRIRLIRQPRAGVSAARNAGLEAAVGEYVYFTDADDTMEPELLEKTRQMADENSADIVEFGYYRDVYKTRKMSALSDAVLPKKDCVKTAPEFSDSIRSYWGETTYYINVHLFRRSIIKEIRFELMPLAEDVVFIMQAFKNANIIVFCRQPLYHYSIRMGSSVNRYQPMRLKCDLVLLRNMEEMLTYMNCSEADRRQMLNERRAGSYLNVLYNLSLPGCRMSLQCKNRLLCKAKEQLNIDELRRGIVPQGGFSEKTKLFLLKHRLDGLMLLFGPAFVRIVRGCGRK